MSPNTKGRFLLITGVPSTGKSCYCGHLRDAHGFCVVLTDCEPSFINEAVARTAGLVDRFLKQHANVAIEWGFHTKFLQQALDLGRQGARLVWFAGDAARAQSDHAKKTHNHPARLKEFDDQMRRIREAALPTNEFQIVRALDKDGFHPHREIDREVLGTAWGEQ